MDYETQLEVLKSISQKALLDNDMDKFYEYAHKADALTSQRNKEIKEALASTEEQLKIEALNFAKFKQKRGLIANSFNDLLPAQKHQYISDKALYNHFNKLNNQLHGNALKPYCMS